MYLSSKCLCFVFDYEVDTPLVITLLHCIINVYTYIGSVTIVTGSFDNEKYYLIQKTTISFPLVAIWENMITYTWLLRIPVWCIDMRVEIYEIYNFIGWDDSGQRRIAQ